MFLGLPYFGMKFLSPMLLGTATRLELRDILVDEIKIDEALIEHAEYLVNNLEWGYDTMLFAQFKNTLSAGNIEAIEIDHLVLKKRKKDEMQWQPVKVFPFDINQNRYNHKDEFIESLDTYEYSVQTEVGGVYGSENIEEIDTEFEGIWFIGNENTYSIEYDIDVSGVNYNIIESTVNTLGNKYPFICRNGVVNYKTFTVNGLLATSETKMKAPKIDARAEKKYMQNVEKFFNDGKPKIYKDDSGRYFICHIMNPQIIPYNELDRKLYNFSCDIVEIGDGYDVDELIENGLLDEREINI